MNAITCKNLMGKTLSFLLSQLASARHTFAAMLALSVALGAATSATADWWAWAGKDNSSTPCYYDDFGTPENGKVKGCWYRSGSSGLDAASFKNYNHWIGYTGGKFTINANWNGTIKFRAVTQQTGGDYLNVSYAAKPVVFVAEDSTCGIDSSKPMKIYEGAELEIDSGTYSFSYFQLGDGNDGTLTMNGGTLKTKSDYSRIGTGSNGTGVFTVKTGAVFDNSQATGNGGNMTLGQSSGSTGTLNVQGGDVTVKGYLAINYDSGSTGSALNITDGGLLSVGYITFRNNGGSGAGTITIDNGTIKARNDHANFIPSHDSLAFTVNAGGGTIDNDGYNITIGAALDGTGSMTFKGNGTTTLSVTPSYTGGTTNIAGTILSFTTAAKTAIFNNPVTVEIPSTGVADGRTVFEINDGNGTFTQADVSAIVVTGTDADRYRLALADNGAKVVISDTLAGEYVWNDGASGESWRTNGKWTKNGVAGDWYDSTAAVFANAGDAATVDTDVTTASVTFRANATVSGTATLTVPSVSVVSAVSATISAPTAGALEKTGAGTLTLGASRTDQTTTLSEGTLVMSGSGVMLNWPNLVFGTDATKPLAVKFENGATATGIHDFYVGSVAGGSVEVVKEVGDWTCGNNLVLCDGLNSTASFIHRGGTLQIPRYIAIGNNKNSDSSSAYFEISGGTVKHTGVDGYLSVGRSGGLGCTNIVAVKTGGTFETPKNIVVGYGTAGTLNIAGGTVLATNATIYICYDSENVLGEDCALNITDGGLLSAKTIRYGSSDSTYGAANATVMFDNGTLRAVQNGSLIVANDKLFVTVGENGGTIDANGKTVTIAEELAGTGGMTYKGSGTVTLSAQPAYSGTTAVEVGTTLVVPAAIAGANLSFSIPDGLSSGLYKVAAVSGDGAFASDVLSSATLPSGENARFFLDNGDKVIWCIYSSNASDHIWIGGAAGSLNDGANWLSGSVPANGTAIIGSASAAALTNPEGSAFAATTIFVPIGSADVTVSGEPLANIVAITNNSSSTIEFKNAVEFSGNIDVVQNTGAVKFTGGVTGVKLARATDIHGTYNFTQNGDLTECDNTTVKSDGVYKLLNGTFYKNLPRISVEAGGKVEVKDAKMFRNQEARLLGAFNGLFVVTNEFLVSGNDASEYVTHYMCNSGSGTLVANKLHITKHACVVPAAKTIIGEGGIMRDGPGYVRVWNNGSNEIGACADWTMYYNAIGSNTGVSYFSFYKQSSSTTWSDLTFDTTDYYDNTIGRTITCEAPIGADGSASAEKFRVTVKGKGKFVFANTSDTTIFSGGLTVTNSATVEVMANSWPGKGAVTLNNTSTLLMHTGGAARTGAITVNNGAALEVAESGTVTLGGNLDLKGGATLKFNFTERGKPPVLNLEGKTVTFGSETNITVSVKGSVRPAYGTAQGKYFLTSGGGFPASDVTVVKADDCASWVKDVAIENGNLYASIIPVGLIIMFN